MKYYYELTEAEKASIDMDALKASVDEMSHFEMCRLWRFGTVGSSPYFDNSHPISEYFQHRLFKHFGGFTPKISKQLGW